MDTLFHLQNISELNAFSMSDRTRNILNGVVSVVSELPKYTGQHTCDHRCWISLCLAMELCI